MIDWHIAAGYVLVLAVLAAAWALIVLAGFGVYRLAS